jgi:type III pantothenate kinase
VVRIVADLGNSRLKWGRLGPSGAVEARLALPLDDPAAWDHAAAVWGCRHGPAEWAIASVNPPVAARFGAWLEGHESWRARRYVSAAEVPVANTLAEPTTTGVDRALAVLAGLKRHQDRGPGLVVACGTAITVERISINGTWEGGAIAAGLGLLARALHTHTALLPLVRTDEAPQAWAASTEPAIAAGVFWGAVGITRELIARQSIGLGISPWIVWTGGDAGRLAPKVTPDAEIVPELVLDGLALTAFGEGAG